MDTSVDRESTPVDRDVKIPVETPVDRESTPVETPVEKHVETLESPIKLRKDPKRVEQGKRLAQISRAAKEAKRQRLHDEEMERLDEEFRQKYDSWFGSWKGCFTIGAGSILLSWVLLNYWGDRKTYVFVPAVKEADSVAPPAKSAVKKFASLD